MSYLFRIDQSGVVGRIGNETKGSIRQRCSRSKVSISTDAAYKKSTIPKERIAIYPARQSPVTKLVASNKKRGTVGTSYAYFV